MTMCSVTHSLLHCYVTDFTAQQYSILVGSKKHSSDGPTAFTSSSYWNTKNTAI